MGSSGEWVRENNGKYVKGSHEIRETGGSEE
jgi:hypothetical protein